MESREQSLEVRIEASHLQPLFYDASASTSASQVPCRIGQLPSSRPSRLIRAGRFLHVDGGRRRHRKKAKVESNPRESHITPGISSTATRNWANSNSRSAPPVLISTRSDSRPTLPHRPTMPSARSCPLSMPAPSTKSPARPISSSLTSPSRSGSLSIPCRPALSVQSEIPGGKAYATTKSPPSVGSITRTTKP